MLGVKLQPATKAREQSTQGDLFSIYLFPAFKAKISPNDGYIDKKKE